MEHLGHPSPHFNDAKMARFCSFATSSLLWGGRGLIVPSYSVQDCSSIGKCRKFAASVVTAKRQILPWPYTANRLQTPKRGVVKNCTGSRERAILKGFRSRSTLGDINGETN